MARAELRKQFDDDTFFRSCGTAEPFYADELVWMHNERGVIHLAMGNLYEARASLERAMDINQRHVEHEDRAHNWRRIRINQLTADIEGGDISLAERKIDELKSISKQNAKRIFKRWKKLPGKGKIESRAFDFRLREDKLADAITDGYRGWCVHLRGSKKDADELYVKAIESLNQLGDEQRAIAYFGRHRANVVKLDDGEVRSRRDEIQQALNSAQSTKQMDIVHRINVALAEELLFGPAPTDESRGEAVRLLDEAMAYALQTETHRVRVEAAITISKARAASGDLEGALRYACDALTIATRNGLELRKINLRAHIAKVMSARGHPITAEHLAKTAIKMATRIGYQTAISTAERVMLKIPRISSLSGNSDRSGRKSF